MKVNKRFYLFSLLSLGMLVLVAMTLFYSWHEINRALDKEHFSSQVNQLTRELQGQLHELEAHNNLGAMKNWEKLQFQLRKILAEPPELSPEQKTLLNSIIRNNTSAVVLFERLNSLTSGLANQSIIRHLEARLRGQMLVIQEDSQQLAALARQSLGEILFNQTLYVMTMLTIGLVTLIFISHRFFRWIQQATHLLMAGLNRIEQGHFESIDLTATRSNDEVYEILLKFNRMSEQLKENTITRDVLQKIVDERTHELTQVANTDSLTSVPNRRALFERGDMEFSRAHRHHQPFALLMIDADHFKHINDQHGHMVGDKVLIHLCQTVEKEVRKVDFFARFGGEEFVLILPHNDEKGAYESACRIQQVVNENPMECDGVSIRLTVSIGVVILHSSHKDFGDMINDADKALLLAKKNGRNRIEFYETPSLSLVKSEKASQINDNNND